jgi:four helix bundle protein
MFVFEKEVKYGNAIVEESYAFGIRIIKFYKYLNKDVSLNPVYKQLLRSGTSIGANVSESQSAFTKKDFINKLGIALKESRETEYWLKILKGAEFITIKEFNSLYNDCEELSKLLTRIIKSSKNNLK